MIAASSSGRFVPPLAVVAGVLVLAVTFGLVVGLVKEPVVVALGLSVIVLIAVIAVSPVVGAFAWLLLGPLVVGIARGEAVPFARPNELLLLVAVLGLALNGWWRISRRQTFLPKLGIVDLTILLLLMAGSVLPVLVLLARGLSPTQDDVLYAMVFVKYFVLYALFRIAVRSEKDVTICLALILGSSAIVALVAVLQVNDLLGIPGLLFAYYDLPFEGVEGAITLRGTSTIASAFGLADLMAMSLAIVVAWWPVNRDARPYLLVAAMLFLAGVWAAGSFSGIIGVAVAVLVAAYVSGQLTSLLALMIPVSLVGTLAFWPVVSARLAGFDNINGLPRSWVGRWENLERFFWPELMSGDRLLLGVRPAARVAAPETWRDWVYIESGHTWLLWSGGVPLLAAFLAFSWFAMRTFIRIARGGIDAIGVAASAAAAGTAMILVLMLFDPHLTVRGGADLFFPLMALALVPRAEASVPIRGDSSEQNEVLEPDHSSLSGARG